MNNINFIHLLITQYTKLHKLHNLINYILSIRETSVSNKYH